MANFFEDYNSGNALGDAIMQRARKAKTDTALTARYGDIAGNPEAAASLQQTDQRAQLFPTAKAQGEASLTATQQANTKNADAERDKARLNAGLFIAQRVSADGPEAGVAAVDDAAKVLGLSPEDATNIKAFITSHPKGAEALVEALKQHYAASSAAGGAGTGQIVFDPDGNAHLVNRQSGDVKDLTATGGAPLRGSAPVQRNRALGIQESNTEQRDRLAGADAQAEKAAGAAAGKVSGINAANYSKVQSQVARSKATIAKLRAMPGLKAIFGSPTIAKAIQSGGFGKLGAAYGSEAADAAAAVALLKSRLFTQAFETLKGGGSITEPEGEAATAAVANLDRAQSYESLLAALDDLEATLDDGLSVAGTQAHMTNYGKKATAPAEATPRSKGQTSDLSDDELLKLYTH